MTDQTPPQTPQDAPESPDPAPAPDTTPDPGQGPDVAALTAERDALVLQVARLQISGETGVPADLLRGGTADELREHAAALKAYAAANPATPAAPPPTPITPDRAPSTDPLRDLLRRP